MLDSHTHVLVCYPSSYYFRTCIVHNKIHLNPNNRNLESYTNQIFTYFNDFVVHQEYDNKRIDTASLYYKSIDVFSNESCMSKTFICFNITLVTNKKHENKQVYEANIYYLSVDILLFNKAHCR